VPFTRREFIPFNSLSLRRLRRRRETRCHLNDKRFNTIRSLRTSLNSSFLTFFSRKRNNAKRRVAVRNELFENRSRSRTWFNARKIARIARSVVVTVGRYARVDAYLCDEHDDEKQYRNNLSLRKYTNFLFFFFVQIKVFK